MNVATGKNRLRSQAISQITAAMLPMTAVTVARISRAFLSDVAEWGVLDGLII